ncbi:hypothetical protein BDV93DRAFT_510634 [Ceratobasidium sp. AG-I]|nr:hypothetical protein BDV93DRAFT_510634 [Ceratobasidium sp. AG-I]
MCVKFGLEQVLCGAAPQRHCCGCVEGRTLIRSGSVRLNLLEQNIADIQKANHAQVQGANPAAAATVAPRAEAPAPAITRKCPVRTQAASLSLDYRSSTQHHAKSLLEITQPGTNPNPESNGETTEEELALPVTSTARNKKRGRGNRNRNLPGVRHPRGKKLTGDTNRQQNVFSLRRSSTKCQNSPEALETP